MEELFYFSYYFRLEIPRVFVILQSSYSNNIIWSIVVFLHPVKQRPESLTFDKNIF